MPFIDRRDAGRRLARLCARYRSEDAIVLGLPRGGVPVAYEVALALGAPLDVMVARKLGAPSHPEFAIGAVAPGGIAVIDDRSIRAMRVSHSELDQVTADEMQEMERRLLAYRGTAKPPDVAGRTVVLVDDGLATGATARAAIRSLRAQGPEMIILAVPVCAPDSAEALRAEADEVLCVESPEDFGAVGLWYDDFSQTNDAEVMELLQAARRRERQPFAREVEIPAGDDTTTLRADLTMPRNPRGMVVFAHGSGSGRKSPRNRHVAQMLNEAGFGTLLLDLLTEEEERIDQRSRHLRFDIGLLSERLGIALDWIGQAPEGQGLGIGVFGASTGAAAAVVAAAEHKHLVQAVVSRGGRPDLADEKLGQVAAPTLLVVGSDDPEVAELNRQALLEIKGHKELRIVTGATHLFEEPGTLDQVAEAAAEWFGEYLRAPRMFRAEEGRALRRRS